MGTLSNTDRQAIYFKIAEAHSDVESYMLSHPDSSRETAVKNAYKYFKRVMGVFDTLPIPVQLKICGLGRDRVYTEINKRLKSTNKVYHQGIEVAENPDNRVRQQATELLSKINRLDNNTDTDFTEEENNKQFEIVDYNAEETTEDLEDEKQ